MTKSTKKKARPAKKPLKTAKSQIEAAEFVNSLLRLHKLQGALLAQLKKQIS